jgi:hypothetical protein
MNREENRDFHESYWGKVLEIFKKVDPKKVSLEDLWSFTTYSEITNNFSLDVNNFDVRSLDNFVIINGFKPVYKSIFKQFVKDKQELITKEIPEGTTQEVDLGSGWGRNSIILANKFPEITFFSLENSEAGVECCKIIKNKYNLKNLICERFDYHEPQMLNKITVPKAHNEKVFYFSSYSIEQIPLLKKELFDIILNSPYSELKFFHIEPIGWQVENREKNTLSRYNNNLFSILQELKEQNLIEIVKVEVDVYGKQNNPGTIVTWKKK